VVRTTNYRRPQTAGPDVHERVLDRDGALAEMYAPTGCEGAAAREIAARAASVMTREGRCVVCIRVRERRVCMRGVNRVEEDGDHATGLTSSLPPAWCQRWSAQVAGSTAPVPANRRTSMHGHSTRRARKTR
jgi:hypothetical protein